MKFKATALTAALALAAVAGTAQAGVLSESASSFSYDSVGLSYLTGENELDHAGLGEYESDGFSLDASVSLTPNVYATVGLSMVDLEDDDNVLEDADDTSLSLGLGYHRDLGLSVPVDFLAEAGVTAVQTEVDSSKGREYALGGKLGLRTSAGIPGLDTTVYLGLTEVAEHDSSGDRDYGFATTYGVSADYFVTPEVSVGAGYEVVDADDDAWFQEQDVTSFSVKYHL